MEKSKEGSETSTENDVLVKSEPSPHKRHKKHKHKKHKRRSQLEEREYFKDLSFDDYSPSKKFGKEEREKASEERVKESTPEKSTEETSVLKVPYLKPEATKGSDSGRSSEAAVKSGKMEEVDDENTNKPKDPQLMTARQPALFGKKTDNEPSPGREQLLALPSVKSERSPKKCDKRHKHKKHKHKKHKRQSQSEDSKGSYDLSFDDCSSSKSFGKEEREKPLGERVKKWTPEESNEEPSVFMSPCSKTENRKGGDSGKSSEAAFKSRKLEEVQVDGESKKIILEDPKLMTARQQAMFGKGEQLLALPSGKCHKGDKSKENNEWKHLKEVEGSQDLSFNDCSPSKPSEKEEMEKRLGERVMDRTPVKSIEKSSMLKLLSPKTEKKKGRESYSGTSSEEERWLDALESGELGELERENKDKLKDPKLMTARQRAMYGKMTNNEPSPGEEQLLALPSGYKERVMTPEALEKAAVRAQRRKERAGEKREKEKRKVMERLVKIQKSKYHSSGSKSGSSVREEVPCISYRTRVDEATVSLPPGIDFPLKPQVLSEKKPPPLVLCGVEGCSNPKKYSCSKTKVPLCSLACYKKNLGIP